MAKEQEKNLAFLYYTKENMEAKDIATKLKVRPNTVGEWIKKGNWKSIRDANINQSGERLDRIQQVVDDLAIERLDIMKSIKEIPIKIRDFENKIRNNTCDDEEKDIEELSFLRDHLKGLKKETVYIDQGIAMWNKTLVSFQSDNKITLTKYIEIMNIIFEGLRSEDEKLYMETLDFQRDHILEAATKYN